MAYPGSQHISKVESGVSLKYLCSKHGYVRTRYLYIDEKLVPICRTCLSAEAGHRNYTLTEAVKGRKKMAVFGIPPERPGPYVCQGCLDTFEKHHEYESHRGACPALGEGDT